VVVIEGSKVVQSGAARELMATEGAFATLFGSS
jgi:ABC-type multidrug transport system fused ATPase/permease subunit